MTVEQIRRALEDTARQRADLREADETLAAQEIQLRAMLTEAKRRTLHSEPGGSRLRRKMQLTSTADREKRIKIAAANDKSASESKRLQLEAGKSDGDIAAFLDVGRSTVAAWHAGKREIPKDYALKMLAEYAIPLSAWPRVRG